MFDGLATPDALIIAGGSNDLNGVRTNVEIQGYFGTVANLFRSRGIPNLYAANILPRTSGESATFEVNRRAHNAWLTGLPNGVRELLNFRDVVSSDDETLNPAYDYDGVHLNAAGYAAIAASISKLVITGTNATRKNRQFKNVREYKLPGATDDAAAIIAAHAANGVVSYPDGDYTPGAVHNIYDTTAYTNAIGPRWQAGRSGQSTSDARPVFWAQKHSSANRATLATEFDNGAGYFGLIKDSGDAYGTGLTGYARHGSSDGGQVIGVTGRAYTPVVQGEVWGGVSYVSNATNVVATSMTGHEVNVVNKAADQGWQAAPTTGRTSALIVAPTDGSSPITHGIVVGNNASAPLGKIHTGILLKSDSIVTSGANTNTAVNDNEAIRIEGASNSSNQYTGIRFRSGTLATGISFKETGFSNNCAILMGDDQRIVVGPGPASSTYFSLNRTTLLANINGMSLAISGTKVVGARITGWGAATGTVDRAAWTAYSAPTVSATYTQAEIQAIANAVQANSRHLAALQQDLTTHGLIGA